MKRSAPYKVGDQAQVLHLAPGLGTCMTTVTIERIWPLQQPGRWMVTYVLSGQGHSASVDINGRDRHGYLIPVS